LIFRALAIAAIVGYMTPAFCHDEWLNHQQVDPQTKNRCCGISDCKLYPLEHAHPRIGGWYLDLTNETIAWARVQPSPDGYMWRCAALNRQPDETICLFAPPMGM